jgi:hypothetical protein
MNTQQAPISKTDAKVPGPVPGAPLSKEYVAAIGRLAYIWGWPLANMQNRHRMFSLAPEPGLMGGLLPVAPIGQNSMLSDYIKPEQRFVTSPNQDVVYGAGFLSLDTQPVIVQVPDFGDRFWVYQIVDQRTDSFAWLGKQYGSKPGLYLLTGPNWKGEVPAGVAGVFRSTTDIGAIFPRIFQDDNTHDRAAIQALLNQVMVYPLSAYTGALKTKDWKAIPTFPQAEQQGSGETQWVVPGKYFDQLASVMDQVPALPGEEAIYALIRSVLDAAAKDTALKAVLAQTASATEAEIIKPMFEFRNNGVAAGNGWRTQKNAACFGTDYFQRTACAKGNMFSNMPNETMYFGQDFDSQGNRLSGTKAYTVTFAKGETPPTDGFWSLTLYNEEHFFAPNVLNRFSLGTKNKSLKTNSDGSLTVYVQTSSPGPDKESNWLPTPNEPFSLYIRAYWPQAAITEGKWTPPAIQMVK